EEVDHWVPPHRGDPQAGRPPQVVGGCAAGAAGARAAGHRIPPAVVSSGTGRWLSASRGPSRARRTRGAAARAPATAGRAGVTKGPWNRAVSAGGGGCRARSWAAVPAAATVVVTARPTAPPICWLVLISPEARPASAGRTPVAEAIRSPTKARPSAAATITN